MSGATRKGLPKCEEMVERYNSRRSVVAMMRCNKPAVAQWFWRDVSDEPKYLCLIHDNKINEEEMRDEIEREYEDAESEVQ